MHILMLSDLETKGGAGIAAARLAKAMCRAGHRVTRLVATNDGRDHPWYTCVLKPPLPLMRRVVRRLFTAGGREKWDRLAAPSIHLRLERLLDDLRPDVINVHNLHGAIKFGWSADLVRICAERAPTVWTLHDMWSFTGRCAYGYDCRKFLTGCDASCPTPKEYPALTPKRIAGAWEQRRRLLTSYYPLAAVTPSRWLAQEAQAGLWARHHIEVIPNGLPLDVYRPIERPLARKSLGIKGLGPILLTASQNLAERRKGGKLLIEAFKRLSRRPLTLVTLGGGRLRVKVKGVQLHPLGYLSDEPINVLAFNAADIFLHPAPVDNLPNVVMEAIACGTPAVGFSIGGMCELVRHKQTGWLAGEVSPESFAGAIETAIDDQKHGVDLRGSCRAVAETEYGADLQAQRYLKLFNLLNGDSGKKASQHFS